MTDQMREEYDNWFDKQSISNPDLYKWGALWQCWQSACASMQAKLDEANKEIERLNNRLNKDSQLFTLACRDAEIKLVRNKLDEANKQALNQDKYILELSKTINIQAKQLHEANAKIASLEEVIRKSRGHLTLNTWMTVITDCRMCSNWKGKYCGSVAQCIDADLFDYPNPVYPIQAWKKTLPEAPIVEDVK